MRDILKAGLKVGAATLASLLGWVVAGKLFALTLGAAGVGLFGLLRQLLQNLTLIGTFNGQTALVQGVASRGTENEQLSYSASVLKIQMLLSGGLALVLLVGAPWLGPWLIPHHPQAVRLLLWLALAMLIMVGQTFVIGILNGYRMVNELVKAQLLGPISVILLVFPMIWLVRKGYPSGYVLMLGGPAIFVSLAAFRSVRRVARFPKLGGWHIDRGDRASFFGMSVVLLLSGVVTTGTQFFQSWLVAKRLGLAMAGQYWVAWSLSMSYVTLVLGSFATFYMPSLSSLKEPEERRSLIRSYLGLSLLAMPLLVSAVVVGKPLVIHGMFSRALLPSLKVMRWMLIGDFFKGISWVLAFPMLAFRDMKWFFWTDVLFSLSLAISAFLWLTGGGGVEGLGFLFVVLYVAYLIVMIYYVRAHHGFRVGREEIQRFFAGLSMILFLSFLTWRDISLRVLPIGSFFLLGGLFLWLSLPRSTWRHAMTWLKERK